MKKFSFSKFSILLILSISLIVTGNNQKWKPGVINWDVISYYAYLPATFIHNDLSFSFLDKEPSLTTKIWTGKTEDGRHYIKMTSGLSIMYAPFFLMAHGVAKLQPDMYASDGYSMVYSLFLILSDIFYTIIGFVFLRKILLLYFSDMITAITIVTIYLGTNMLYYSTYEVMSHCYLFSLITIFIYYTIKWYELPNLRYSIFLGALLGLITLIRPIDIMMVSIWLLYDLRTFRSIKTRLAYLLKNKKYVLIIGTLTFAVFSIQLCYWKYATGSWIYWSYSEEGFFWLKPHIMDGLFSFRKGWYIYTPLMFLSTIGLFLLYRTTAKRFFTAFLFLFVVFNYVVFSWWCWWYGGSLSARPMIDIYGMMAIGLASFISFIAQLRSTVIKYIAGLLICFFTFYAIFLTVQYHLGLLHFDSMNYTTWKKGFLTFFVPEDYFKNMSSPNYEKAMKYGKED